MFGDMMGMMGKLKETQQKIEEAKARLNHVLVDEIAADGSVKVTITANREIKSIQINEALLEDKEALEDYLIIIHVLDILLGGVGVVEAQVTHSAVLLCDAEVHADSLGVADM